MDGLAGRFCHRVPQGNVASGESVHLEPRGMAAFTHCTVQALPVKLHVPGILSNQERTAQVFHYGSRCIGRDRALAFAVTHDSIVRLDSDYHCFVIASKHGTPPTLRDLVLGGRGFGICEAKGKRSYVDYLQIEPRIESVGRNRNRIARMK